MARFDRAIAVAQRLIKKNGQLVTWRQVFDPVLTDPLKPWNGGASQSVDYSVYICFVPVFTREDVKTFKYVTANEVQFGKTYGLMAGGISFQPTARDVVVRDGKELRISWLDDLRPNNQSVLFTAEFVL